MRCRQTAGLLVLAVVVGCEADLTTPASSDTSANESEVTTASSTVDPDTCLTCTFEPRQLTRGTGQPLTEVVEFAGNPAGAYTIEFDDHGSRGGQTNVELNGKRIHVRSGVVRQAVALDWDNVLKVRLAGKPGSRLDVRVFQEIASVAVTPATVTSRLPATLQLEAVALDRNGVAIPRQTFTWASHRLMVATVDQDGLASTVGPVADMHAWNYKTISTGVGDVGFVARADGTHMSGSATWTVTAGFVYTTFQAPRSIEDPNHANRPFAVAYSYDSTRIAGMIDTCGVETYNIKWRPQQAPGIGERQFRQCYLRLETETPTRHVIGNIEISGSDSNVGLYGRYCGAGQPDREWWELALAPGYQPLDPIDAMCMEHDRSEVLHDLHAIFDAATAACIVLWGIEADQLHEDGVRVARNSPRWNVFMNTFRDLADARAHWLHDTARACNNNVAQIYDNFLQDRGLDRP